MLPFDRISHSTKSPWLGSQKSELGQTREVDMDLPGSSRPEDENVTVVVLLLLLLLWLLLLFQ